MPSARSTWTGITNFGIEKNKISGRVPNSWSTWTSLSQLTIDCNYLDRQWSGYKIYPVPSPIDSSSSTFWVNQSDNKAPIIGTL